MDNFVLVVAGASASGKTTVAHRIIELDPRFELIRSVTTRPKRLDSFDNEYIYLSEHEFDEIIKNNGVVEYTEYGGYCYGTPISEIKRVTDNGGIPLLILDINGIKNISKCKDYDSCSVYIYSDINLLEQRLYDRYLSVEPTPANLASFIRRKEQNLGDFLSMPDYFELFYAFVENGEIAQCAQDVIDLFSAFCDGRTASLAVNKNIAEKLSLEAKAKIKE